MKKSELKNIIKECVKEVLFEEGVLSGIIAEVAVGVAKAQSLVTEQTTPDFKISSGKTKTRENLEEKEIQESKRRRLLETKKKMLNAIGDASMMNVFEGTTPLSTAGSPDNATTPTSPMSGISPNDPGVDISKLFGLAGKKWNLLK